MLERGLLGTKGTIFKYPRGDVMAGKRKPKEASLPSSTESPRKTRKRPESVRIRQILPSLTVNDINLSLAWYRDILGFVTIRVWANHGKTTSAILRAGDTEFLVTQDDPNRGRERPKGEGLRLYCLTRQDVDRLAEDIQARGGRLAQEPKDQPWGARDLAVIDPDGFRISIASWDR